MFTVCISSHLTKHFVKSTIYRLALIAITRCMVPILQFTVFIVSHFSCDWNSIPSRSSQGKMLFRRNLNIYISLNLSAASWADVSPLFQCHRTATVGSHSLSQSIHYRITQNMSLDDKIEKNRENLLMSAWPGIARSLKVDKKVFQKRRVVSCETIFDICASLFLAKWPREDYFYSNQNDDALLTIYLHTTFISRTSRPRALMITAKWDWKHFIWKRRENFQMR